MTEDDWPPERHWLEQKDIRAMYHYGLHYVEGPASDRKMRLACVAIGRRVWCRMSDDRCRRAVEVAERFADGAATEEEREAAWQDADSASQEEATNLADKSVRHVAVHYSWNKVGYQYLLHQAEDAAVDIGFSSGAKTNEETAPHIAADELWQTAILRDIFGNPFRPVSLDKPWLTSTVTSLAQAIYEERQLPAGLFDNHRLAILADALEETGCDNADILGHLRGGGAHVRGCWVVDSILGKE